MCGSWRELSSDIPRTATTLGDTVTLLGIPTDEVVVESVDSDDVMDAELVVSLDIGFNVVESGTIDVSPEVVVSPEPAVVEPDPDTVSAVVVLSDVVVVIVVAGLVVDW